MHVCDVVVDSVGLERLLPVLWWGAGCTYPAFAGCWLASRVAPGKGARDSQTEPVDVQSIAATNVPGHKSKAPTQSRQ